METNAADSTAAQQVAHFQSVDAVFAQQDVVEQQIKDLAARKLELEEKLNAPPADASQAGEAYPFVELDRVKDELASEQSRASQIDDRVTAAKAALEKAQRSFDESEAKRRQSQEAFEQNKTAPNVHELAAAAEVAQQAAKLAAETVTLRTREVERERLSHEVQQLVVRVCQRQVARLAPLVKFSEADYQEQLEQIKKKEDAAHRSLASAQKYLHEANVELRELQPRLEAETGDRTLLTEQIEAQRRRRERRSDEIDSLTQRLSWLAQLRVAWNRRYNMATAGGSGDTATAATLAWSELKDWQTETQAVIDELARQSAHQIFAIRTIRSSLTSVSKKIDAAKERSPEVLTALNTQQSQVEAMLRIHETNLVTIETSRRVHEKLLDELGRGVLALNPKNLALGAWHQAVRHLADGDHEDRGPRRSLSARSCSALSCSSAAGFDARVLSAHVRQPLFETLSAEQRRHRRDPHARLLFSDGDRHACMPCGRSMCRSRRSRCSAVRWPSASASAARRW